MRRSRAGRAVLAVLLAALLTVCGLLAYDAAGRLPGGVFADRTPAASPSATPTSTPTVQRPPAPAVLPPAAGAAPGPTRAGVTRTLTPLLRDPALGSSVGGVVIDATTGTSLYTRSATAARTPASLAKLLTAAGALSALDAEHRLATTVVQGEAPGDLVLVGGGDPTLTSARQPAGAYPKRASLQALANRCAALLKKQGSSAKVRVSVDATLFAGPSTARSWPSTYVSSGVVGRVSALSVDGGRLAPDTTERSADPAVDAGRRFAAALRRAGVPVATAVARAGAPPGAAELAREQSPTIPSLVEQMLRTSDNDLSEALLRHVAIARSEPATFDGGTDAVLAQLDEIGVSARGTTLLDGSGLSRGSRVAPATVAGVLTAASDPEQPSLRPLLTGLPVAGFNGTLAERYTVASTRAAAGAVRAKTGTLTGVSALAGVVHVRGRVLVFALMADRVAADGTLTARDRLDRAAAALAACGCR